MPALRAFFFMKKFSLVVLLLGSFAALADAPSPSANGNAEIPARNKPVLGLFKRDPDAYSMVSATEGLSAHKPTYILPFTYSPDYTGSRSEVIFQISAKQRLFARNLYFGYTQKSFWELYNQKQSAPFRETDYNPEMFYRWILDPQQYHHWGADIGFEHESNGQSVPQSRSWNRIYFSPFQARGKQLAYFKIWYRIPEGEKSSPDAARGDDNPDIERYMGYGEIQFQRQFDDEGQFAFQLHGNPATGRAGGWLMYSRPNADHSLFYCIRLWQGYGESLIDYNTSVTRLGIGVMLAR